jgi:hypothetical protein
MALLRGRLVAHSQMQTPIVRDRGSARRSWLGIMRMEEMMWQAIDSAPEGEVVLTKIDDREGERNVQKLKRSGRLWFVPDGSIYVYYSPTHWKPQ